jgi:hypothetical protein
VENGNPGIVFHSNLSRKLRQKEKLENPVRDVRTGYGPAAFLLDPPSILFYTSGIKRQVLQTGNQEAGLRKILIPG